MLSILRKNTNLNCFNKNFFCFINAFKRKHSISICSSGRDTPAEGAGTNCAVLPSSQSPTPCRIFFIESEISFEVSFRHDVCFNTAVKQKEIITFNYLTNFAQNRAKDKSSVSRLG